MTSRPILAGVVGHPVRHSLSPLIHSTWANRAGVNGYYIPIDAPPSYEEFAAIIDSLRKIGFAGINVTIPHKEHALHYADEASDVARNVGAANMLTFQDGRAFADNSDVEGFAAGLKAAIGARSEIASAIVLGAGGAARAIICALQEYGISKIVITNRTAARAEALAEEFALATAGWDSRDDALQMADLVVNTTSLGMTGLPPLALDVGKIKPGAIVADIVYSPLETRLLKSANASGHAVIDGLSMLMHQAAPGFHQWFGAEGVVDQDLRSALIAVLNRRNMS